MKTSTYATITGFGLLITAGLSGPAGANTTIPAWQESGYVMDVVIATAPRPEDNAAGQARSDDPRDSSLPQLADIVISTGSNRELQEQAAEAVRDALAEIRISFDGLQDSRQDHESVL
jgi:hypothetical protein